jgi:hypothetical protein
MIIINEGVRIFAGFQGEENPHSIATQLHPETAAHNKPA